MKKTYSKPIIVFESFQLSSSIASTCTEHNVNSADVNSCAYSWNGLTIFVGADGCMDGLYDEDGTCYHNALDTSLVFSS